MISSDKLFSIVYTVKPAHAVTSIKQSDQAVTSIKQSDQAVTSIKQSDQAVTSIKQSHVLKDHLFLVLL
jgi:hypothetical protein